MPKELQPKQQGHWKTGGRRGKSRLVRRRQAKQSKAKQPTHTHQLKASSAGPGPKIASNWDPSFRFREGPRGRGHSIGTGIGIGGPMTFGPFRGGTGGQVYLQAGLINRCDGRDWGITDRSRDGWLAACLTASLATIRQQLRTHTWPLSVPPWAGCWAGLGWGSAHPLFAGLSR